MLKIGIYQKKNVVGNLKKNFNQISNYYLNNLNLHLIVTPELSLTGYIPKDTLFLEDFKQQVEYYIEQLKHITINKTTWLVVGSIYYINNKPHNAALVFNNGNLQQVIIKQKLPNYGIFNEVRFFNTTSTNNIITINNTKIALVICEDLWHNNFLHNLYKEEPNLCISINASPLEITKDFNKHNNRTTVVANAVNILKCPVFYLNTVGGFDEVVFDGASFAMQTNKQLLNNMKLFEEEFLIVNYEGNQFINNNSLPTNNYSYEEIIYKAIMLGLQDFIENNNFKGVLLALSGGIDSALTAVMVCDAIGADKLKTVFMPSVYSNKLSNDIVNEMHNNINFTLQTINISSILSSYTNVLNTTHINIETNNITENLQARIRGQLIMAYSNANPGYIVLTTGNKSEIATGYCTMYGDTVGAFNLLKDLYKTTVYQISNWRNNNIPSNSKLPKLNVLPNSVITRKPSAELKDNQFDEDNLMPYEILDNILYNAIELNMSNQQLCQKYSTELVVKALNLLHNSHYKRLQSAIGIKVSTHSFGTDYNYPLTNGFNRANLINKS